MEPDQIGQNLKTCLEILSAAGDVALLLRQNSKTLMSFRQIMLPSSVTRILINKIPHNRARHVFAPSRRPDPLSLPPRHLPSYNRSPYLIATRYCPAPLT